VGIGSFRAGYGLEFDSNGCLGSPRIDFESVAAHLLAIQEAARRNSLRIERVIIAPRYIPLLEARSSGQRIGDSIPFMRTEAWIRHDEHYHVDFGLVSKEATPGS
jgi:penicillin-insensitive murein endopeptidase